MLSQMLCRICVEVAFDTYSGLVWPHDLSSFGLLSGSRHDVWAVAFAGTTSNAELSSSFFCKWLRWAKSRDGYRRITRELSLRFESLAFVGGHMSLENTEISPHRPCIRCAAIRITRLAFVSHSFHMELRNGLRELTAFAECLRVAIGDFAHLRQVVIEGTA